MTNNENQRLCGGTFFTLLLQARKTRKRVREHYIGESDGMSDPDVLIGLIKVIISDYPEPTSSNMGTFKGNTSEYKSCKISGSTYLPFNDTAALKAFDSRIRSDYHCALKEMSDFIAEFIDAGTSTKKDEHLVKALLELIEKDDSIRDEQVFLACEDGSAVDKSDLLNTLKICLQSFLLGIWHFILLYRRDNKVGKATYDAWCPPRGGAERMYTAMLGESITRPVNVYVCEFSEAEIIDDAPSEPDTEDDASGAAQQAMNKAIVFNQIGNNNIQIGNIETLTINNN